MAVTRMESRPFGRCLATGIALMGLVFFTTACQRETKADAGELRVVLHPAEGSARPAYVEVSGLGTEELTAARRRVADEAAMSSLLRVTVADQADANLPAIAGRYGISDRAL